jgi:hypothetical protein
LFSGALRKAPDSYAAVSTSRLVLKDRRDSTWKFDRTWMPCASERCSRIALSSWALGVVARRTVA